jgi:hypothetical protein
MNILSGIAIIAFAAYVVFILYWCMKILDAILEEWSE